MSRRPGESIHGCWDIAQTHRPYEDSCRAAAISAGSAIQNAWMICGPIPAAAGAVYEALYESGPAARATSIIATAVARTRSRNPGPLGGSLHQQAAPSPDRAPPAPGKDH